MPTVSLQVPDQLLALLEEESKARGTSSTELARACLEHALKASTAHRSAIGVQAPHAQYLRNLGRESARP